MWRSDQLGRYTSKGKTIMPSNQHKDLWIIVLPGNRQYTIETSSEVMHRMNPPDKPKVSVKTIPTKQINRKPVTL